METTALVDAALYFGSMSVAAVTVQGAPHSWEPVVIYNLDSIHSLSSEWHGRILSKLIILVLFPNGCVIVSLNPEIIALRNYNLNFWEII